MLSYLGIISLDDPTTGLTSLGTLLSNAQGNVLSYPHTLLYPALVISLLMISFNLLGNGLRDAFNPTLNGTED
jgi:oligopeptide transport system permease protein